VASRTPPSRHLGAVAAALAVLDAAVLQGACEPRSVAREMEAAVLAARPLGARPRGQARILASPYMERHPAMPSSASGAAESPFLRTATELLGRAGLDLGAEVGLAGRLVAALDVVLAHWIADAAPGRGLPEFSSEDRLRSDKRLAVRLGSDRDLLYLVYGPQPGRGRPLQEARRRGLAYWVALSWSAERSGRPSSHPPMHVLAHWRRELCRLGPFAGSAFAGAADSPDAPAALG